MNRLIKLVLASALVLVITSLGHAALPDPGMVIEPGRTALVITDPQNDFLSPEGVTWGVVGKSVTANDTVKNIERLFQAAKANGHPCLHFASLLLPNRPSLAVRRCTRKVDA